MPEYCRLPESELEAALEAAFQRGEAMGRERGRTEQREETARLAKAMVVLNGDGHKFAAALDALAAPIGKAFDESKIHRNHGQFSSTSGTADRSAVLEAEKPANPHESQVGATGDRPDPDAHARTLAERIREVPAHVAQKVRSFVQQRYEKLRTRYGDAGAKAILGAMVMLLPVPVPGSSLLPVAVAEAVLRVRQAIGKGLEPEELLAA
jgi:hypothetical protein